MRATPGGAGVDRLARDGVEQQASTTAAALASRYRPRAVEREHVTRRL
jgi:hypothetical protein